MVTVIYIISLEKIKKANFVIIIFFKRIHYSFFMADFFWRFLTYG